jgi:hypothetical protein
LPPTPESEIQTFRQRTIAQTRFRFLRTAWKTSRRSPSGTAMRSPRAAPLS